MPKKPSRVARPAKSVGQKVGRGRPPKHSQFVPGESGNAKGRPKGSKNLKTIIMEAAHKKVVATVGGKSRKISTLQASAMQMATAAASGNPSMIAKFLDWVDEIESRAAAARPVQFPFAAADLEILRAIHDRMKLCEPPETRE